jgi:hypothetical protein
MMSSRAAAFAWAVAALVIVALEVCAAAAGEDRTFAGSAQVDYHLVAGDETAASEPGTYTTFRGFTFESALKAAVDISDQLSANVKVCFGCHGFELDMAYFDWRPLDEIGLRAGRFSPSFGAFNLRHDPANHGLSDKPLPYDMGRMLRKGVWNNGVLPAPFPATGAEIGGTHWFESVAQLDYAVYAVSGFRNDVDPHPYDLDFQESHLLYYIDATPRPELGARVAFTVKASLGTDVTFGLSAMRGTYDPNNRFAYEIGGADLTIRAGRTAIRLEYVGRVQQFDTSYPWALKYSVASDRGNYFIKEGAYLELEQPLSSRFDLLARVDGLAHLGNVSLAEVGSGNVQPYANPLTSESTVVRETLGLAFTVQRNLRLKASGELWEFSDPDGEGHKTTLGGHFAAVGSF